MSDLELLGFVKDIPLQKNFQLSHDEMVLPITVTELWENFFDDYALYSFDDVGVATGVYYNSKTEWEETDQTFKGKEVLKTQVTEMKIELPPNPLASYIDNQRTSYLLEQSPTTMVIHSKDLGSGMMYADRYVTEMRWEAYQPTEDSQSCVIRHSFMFKWLDEPWLVGSVLQAAVQEKIKTTAKYTLDYYLMDKVVAYQAIKNGEVEAPTTEEDNEVMRLKKMVDREFDRALNKIVEDNDTLQVKIITVMVLAAIINICLCCCFGPYAIQLIRRSRQIKQKKEELLSTNNKEREDDLGTEF